MSFLLGYDEVRCLLPQSYPFVMVDVVEELQPGECIVCRKNITGNEWMFPGHFADRAIFPGVLLIEGLAQSSILLLRADPTPTVTVAEDATYMLANVKARFLKPVVPGDQVRYICQAIRLASTGGVIEAQAQVEGTVVVKADLTFAIQHSAKEQ